MEVLKKQSKVLENTSLWTNVYGFSRSLLAFGTLLTLVFNDTSVLFKSASGVPECPMCLDITKIGLFCLFKGYSLDVAKYLSILILILVISGWRPRITGVLHWWVVFSLNSSAITLDGGDQVANVLCFLLVPFTLLDPRISHWQNYMEVTENNKLSSIFGKLNMYVVRIQIAAIYFHAFVGKFKITEWVDGTALYYFMQDPLFGGVSPVILDIFKSPVILTSATWSVLILEIVLFLGIVIPQAQRGYLLVLGIVFHVAIMVVFGLISFGCSMIAALILYLRPWNHSFEWSSCKFPLFSFNSRLRQV